MGLLSGRMVAGTRGVVPTIGCGVGAVHETTLAGVSGRVSTEWTVVVTVGCIGTMAY